MTPVRAIARFFLLLVFFYTLLMLPWPGLQRTYGRLFRAGAGYVFGSFGSDGSVRFSPNPDADHAIDTMVFMANRRTGAGAEGGFSSRGMGYVPLAFLTALILATPMPKLRRAWAFVWGILLLHAFIVLIMSVHIFQAFAADNRVALFTVSGFWRRTLLDVLTFVVFAPFFSLVVPTFVWILVSFRHGDIRMILDRTGLGLRSINHAKPTALPPR